MHLWSTGILQRLAEETAAAAGRAGRRERIATAALAGILANPGSTHLGHCVAMAVEAADMLIKELDK